MHLREVFAAFLLLCFLISTPALAKNNQGTEIGFTPWPYDLTEEALNETYDFINKNSTIISHHLDGGVPWQEALDGKVLPKHLLDDWKRRKEKTSERTKVFLSLTPINFSRDGIAAYWGDKGDNLPLPRYWKDKSFKDPEVILAYTRYVLAAIKFFEPEYLAIGIESNVIITHSPEKWDDYLVLNQSVYKAVKRQYPDLSVFATVQYEHLRGIEDVSKKNHGLQKSAVVELLKFSDLLALSTYKYGFIHPNKISDNYFNEALSFEKPLAIAEMGAMSETTFVMGIPLFASEGNQKEFVEMVLENAKKHNFAFVINWVAIDFDEMLLKLPSEFRAVAKAWVHTGLWDEDRDPRPAFKVWEEYLNRK